MNKLLKNIKTEDVFVDTSAWFSLLYEKDNFHEKIASIYNSLLKNHNTLITSNLIVGETFTLMRYKLDKKSTKPFELIETVQTSQRIKNIFIDRKTEERAINILKKYSDHKFSYVDATSFALMNNLDIKYSLTLDNNFSTAGFIIL